MKYYFQVQFKMLNRHLTDFGIAPIIAYALVVIAFIYGSHVFFERYEIAQYLYPFWGISLLLKLSKKERNDFLQLSFSVKKYTQVRILENSLLIFPFVLFLSYKTAFLMALATYVIAVCLSFLKVQLNINFTIPTPFKKRPFEFIEGFRNTFYVFFLAYGLSIIAIKVQNFNLAIFSLLLVFGVCMAYFSKTENAYFVWAFNQNSKEFLCRKINTAFIYVSWLSIPICLLLLVFFTDKIIIIIAFQCMGYAYLAQYIFAKYSVFPNQMSLPTILVFGLSIAFPPFIFFTFWYFYKQAINKVNLFLHD